jgi:coenzyme F420-reducing hydrogenase gamma subunit
MMNTSKQKLKVAIHKFSSCDGCQLAFINSGERLLQLTELVDIVHFVEAGPINEEMAVDLAFVEGSISTSEEEKRIKAIRANSQYLITMGACATSGGLQALRNLNDVKAWTAGVYAHPEYISALSTATAIAQHVRVDLELWGCPVNSYQIFSAIRALLFGVTPKPEPDKLCSECKRINTVCVMVTKGVPCMGPVTLTGCGVLCPRYERDCYACYGPAENVNTDSLTQRFKELGLSSQSIAHRFLFINNAAPPFAKAGQNLLSS